LGLLSERSSTGTGRDFNGEASGYQRGDRHGADREVRPPASVSGLYFAHPEAHYFGVGRIEKDQVEDYARRKGWDVKTAERWLAPILNYEAG
jgi:hypothetical protein